MIKKLYMSSMPFFILILLSGCSTFTDVSNLSEPPESVAGVELNESALKNVGRENYSTPKKSRYVTIDGQKYSTKNDISDYYQYRKVWSDIPDSCQKLIDIKGGVNPYRSKNVINTLVSNCEKRIAEEREVAKEWLAGVEEADAKSASEFLAEKKAQLKAMEAVREAEKEAREKEKVASKLRTAEKKRSEENKRRSLMDALSATKVMKLLNENEINSTKALALTPNQRFPTHIGAVLMCFEKGFSPDDVNLDIDNNDLVVEFKNAQADRGKTDVKLVFEERSNYWLSTAVHSYNQKFTDRASKFTVLTGGLERGGCLE